MNCENDEKVIIVPEKYLSITGWQAVRQCKYTLDPNHFTFLCESDDMVFNQKVMAVCSSFQATNKICHLVYSHSFFFFELQNIFPYSINQFNISERRFLILVIKSGKKTWNNWGLYLQLNILLLQMILLSLFLTIKKYTSMILEIASIQDDFGTD